VSLATAKRGFNSPIGGKQFFAVAKAPHQTVRDENQNQTAKGQSSFKNMSTRRKQ